MLGSNYYESHQALAPWPGIWKAVHCHSSHVSGSAAWCTPCALSYLSTRYVAIATVSHNFTPGLGSSIAGARPLGLSKVKGCPWSSFISASHALTTAALLNLLHVKLSSPTPCCVSISPYGSPTPKGPSSTDIYAKQAVPSICESYLQEVQIPTETHCTPENKRGRISRKICLYPRHCSHTFENIPSFTSTTWISSHHSAAMFRT